MRRSVQSIQNQTYTNWNLIVVDDGSTDQSVEDLKAYLSANSQEPLELLDSGFRIGRITTLRLSQNRGVSQARNWAIRQTKADWIAFLDSDDEWLAQKLEKQIKYAEQKPQYSLIHCNETWFKEGQILHQKKKHKKQGGRIFIPSVQLCCISPSAVLLKRELLNEVGLFREDFPVCEDYELWLRITSRYEVGFLEEPLLIKHGGHADQLSRKYFAMDYWRVQALKPYLTEERLSSEERQAVKQSLIERLEILLKGYEKHRNFKHQKEIQELYSSVMERRLS